MTDRLRLEWYLEGCEKGYSMADYIERLGVNPKILDLSSLA
jgi:hypothetical protein